MGFYKSAEEIYSEMESTLKDIDNSESSFIYNANMPVAHELSYLTMIADEMDKKNHAKTALYSGYDEDLIKRCEDFGIIRNLKTKATGVVTLTGNPGSILPANSVVAATGSITFITDYEVTIVADGTAKVSVTASDYGSKYNTPANTINSFPITYEGILTVTNEEEITNGYDDEDMEHLYERYKERVSEIIVAGNVPWYKNLVKEVTGVGDCKGYECMDENKQHANNNVLLIITDSNRKKASDELIQKVSDHVEEKRLVGAKVNIISANELNIDVYAKIVYNSKVTTEDKIKEEIKEAIQKYFAALDFLTEYVSVYKINSIIFSIADVIDVRGVKLNGLEENVNVAGDEIPVFNDLTVEVV